MTYFRAGGHYHRPRELNGRVRNGNGCFLTRKVTGKALPARQRDGREKAAKLWKLVDVKPLSITNANSKAGVCLGEILANQESKWPSFCPLVPVD